MISLYDMFVSELVFKLYYFKILMVFEFFTKLNRKHFYCSEQSALYESYYSSPGKIDTGKIDTFSEISRNFEKNNNTLFGLYRTRNFILNIIHHFLSHYMQTSQNFRTDSEFALLGSVQFL